MATPSSAEVAADVVADKGSVQIWALALAAVVLLLLLSLVRHQKLKASYSLLWFGGWAGLTLLIIQPHLMDLLGRTLGIAYSPTLLLLGVQCAFGLILLHMTTVITRQSRQINRLAQDIALFKEERR